MKINDNGKVILELSQNGLLEVLEKPAHIEVMILQGQLISISPKVWDQAHPIVEEELNIYKEDYTRY